jgi:AGCS family alanine or glycine:cation symporter
MRILNDYDNQRAAGIKTPVFDSSQFPDLDLDRKAWPANPAKPDVAPSAELNAQTQR